MFTIKQNQCSRSITRSEANCGALSCGRAANRRSTAPLARFLSALLATLFLLFGLQGEQILRQPAVIARSAVLMIIQYYFQH